MLMVVFGLMLGTLHCQVMQRGWAVRGGVRADSRPEISSSFQGSDTSWTAAILPGVGAAFMDTSAFGPLSGLIMDSSTVLNCCGSPGLMGTLGQSCGSSGLMGTSTLLLGRQGLRKASRSGSTGTSGLPMASQSDLRAHSGVMGTSTCSWARSGLVGWSSMIVKGSCLGLTELWGCFEIREACLGGCSGLMYTSQPGPVVLGTEESMGQTVWSLKESTAGGGGCTMVMEEVVRQSWAVASPSPTMVPCLWEDGTSWLTTDSSQGLCSMMGLSEGIQETGEAGTIHWFVVGNLIN